MKDTQAMKSSDEIDTQSSRAYWNAWTIILLILPVVAYGWTVVFYATDGPIYEDHEGYGFLIQYYDAATLADKLSAFLVQATDHRPITAYLTFLLQNTLLGHVSFLTVIYISNFMVLALAALHLYQMRDSEQFLPIAFVVVYLSFQLVAIGQMYWGGAGLVGAYVLFFAYLSFYLLSKQTFWGTVAAIICALFSIASLSNGLAVLPAALCLLLAGNLRKTLLIKQLLAYEVFAGIAAYTLFPQRMQGSSASELLIEKITHPDLLKISEDVLRLLGGPFSFGNKYLQYTLGLSVLVALGIVIWRRYYRRRPVLMAYLLFLLASIVAICLGRKSWWLLDVDANQSRYFFIAMQVWVVLGIALIELYYSRLQQLASFVPKLAVLVLMLSLVTTYVLSFQRVINYCWNKKIYTRQQIKRIETTTFKPSDSGGRLGNTFNYFAQEAIKRGYYRIDFVNADSPPRFFSDKVACYIDNRK